jgi:Uma2 family endonuclease
MSVEVSPRPFTVDEYHRIADAGVFRADDRVELLDGKIMMMSPIGWRHAACVDRMNRLLNRLVGDQAIVRVQSPVRLAENSEPQPDIALLKPRDDFYVRGHPTPNDVLLIIEISESSLHYDRHEKLPEYAKAAIPEVWLVDLMGDSVLTFCEPLVGTYQKAGQAVRGMELTIRALSNLKVFTDAVLG